MKPRLGSADYLLYIDRKAIGAVEAKAEGTLGTHPLKLSLKDLRQLKDALPGPPLAATQEHLRSGLVRYYSKHMATMKLKVARIGNSRGVRLPAASLRRYRIGETVLMEERSEGILLRPTGPVVRKLSWEDTAREMAASREDWSAWDTTAADGLDELPWQADRKGRVSESPTRYRARPGPGKRR